MLRLVKTVIVCAGSGGRERADIKPQLPHKPPRDIEF